LIQSPRGYPTYNNAEFLTRPIGEVQLLSVSGGGTIVDIIPLTFEFSISRNRTAVDDEGFPDLTMKGHDLLDYGLVETYDPTSKLTIVTPQYRIVHQIAEPADYTLLKLPI